MSFVKVFASRIDADPMVVRRDLTEEEFKSIETIAARWHGNMVERLGKVRRSIPEYGALMPLEEFVDNCPDAYTDYDGYALYATETEVCEIVALPSEICAGVIAKGFSHVVWFGK